MYKMHELQVLLAVLAVIALVLLKVSRKPPEKFVEPTRQVIALQAHLCNDQLLYTLRRMRQELPFKVVVLFDNTKGGFKADLAGDLAPCHVTTDAGLKEVNRLHKDSWYNKDSALVSLWRSGLVGDADYLWLIEYDVYCDGNWSQALAATSGMPHDMLSTFMERYSTGDRTWMWWPHVTGEDAVPKDRRVKSFAPVCRFSRRAMQVLHDMSGKMSGYCEVYIPSVLDARGCTWANLPQRMLGKFECYETCRSSTAPRRGDNRLHHKMVWDEKKT